MAKQITMGIEELKNLLRNYASTAIARSLNDGSEKYGDRWKTTGWSSIKALTDSKWDMFINLLDTGTGEEVDHHASDMIAWITILAGRSVWGIKQEDKRETVIINARGLDTSNVHIDGKIEGTGVAKLFDALLAGKRVVIE